MRKLKGGKSKLKGVKELEGGIHDDYLFKACLHYYSSNGRSGGS